MPRRHNTILHDRVPLSPGATPLEKDLPINPISHITIALTCLGLNPNTVPTVSNILGTIANVEVLLEGRTLAQGSLSDLAALTTALWGVGPTIQPITQTQTYTIRTAVHIPFSRRAWLPTEAIPTTRKGDLTLRITPATDYINVGSLSLTVEVRQILDQAPERFLKYSTYTKTPTTTGVHEADLLTGPDYVGVLFYGTTVPSADSIDASISKLKLKVDDVEQMIPESRHECLYAEWQTTRNLPYSALDHTHLTNLEAAYTRYADTSLPQLTNNLYSHYLYVDFDPVKDLSYRLITRGRSRCHFVISNDVADQIRMLPIELVALTTEAAPAAA